MRTDRLIAGGVERAVTAALNAPATQSALSELLMAQLKPLTSLRSVAMYNGSVYMVV